MKAQYEVLGWRSEKASRPGRDDRQLLTLVKPHARDQEPNLSIVTSLLHYFPALHTGHLLSSGPSLLRPPGYGGQAGTTPSVHIASPYVDAHRRLPDPLTSMTYQGT